MVQLTGGFGPLHASELVAPPVTKKPLPPWVPGKVLLLLMPPPPPTFAAPPPGIIGGSGVPAVPPQPKNAAEIEAKPITRKKDFISRIANALGWKSPYPQICPTIDLGFRKSARRQKRVVSSTTLLTTTLVIHRTDPTKLVWNPFSKREFAVKLSPRAASSQRQKCNPCSQSRSAEIHRDIPF
jgi:hypothetical protein